MMSVFITIKGIRRSVRTEAMRLIILLFRLEGSCAPPKVGSADVLDQPTRARNLSSERIAMALTRRIMT